MRIDTFQCVGNALVDRPVESTSLRARSDPMIGIRKESGSGTNPLAPLPFASGSAPAGSASCSKVE